MVVEGSDAMAIGALRCRRSRSSRMSAVRATRSNADVEVRGIEKPDRWRTRVRGLARVHASPRLRR